MIGQGKFSASLAKWKAVECKICLSYKPQGLVLATFYWWLDNNLKSMLDKSSNGY